MCVVCTRWRSVLTVCGDVIFWWKNKGDDWVTLAATLYFGHMRIVRPYSSSSYPWVYLQHNTTIDPISTCAPNRPRNASKRSLPHYPLCHWIVFHLPLLLWRSSSSTTFSPSSRSHSTPPPPHHLRLLCLGPHVDIGPGVFIYYIRIEIGTTTCDVVSVYGILFKGYATATATHPQPPHILRLIMY